MLGKTVSHYKIIKKLGEGLYPYAFIAEHCPFMAPLRGTSRWAAILEKAQRQADNFEREVGASHLKAKSPSLVFS